MAKNKGTLVIDTIRPQDSNDTFPVADANELIGGVHSVASYARRNDIPEERRRLGLICYVHISGKYYYLKHGITNEDWKVFNDDTVEYKTVTESFDMDLETVNENKYVELEYQPDTAPVVLVTHGTAQKLGTDYYIDGKRLKWDNHGLETVLDTTDQLLIIYKVHTNE